ncbi:MAG: VTT domain-containing protein [Verrucomicrobiota bacterium]|nr:VTT domain-containing protein [Verrucomicrobiota bacterium]
MRLLWIALGLAVLLLVPFALWGENFTAWFTGDAVIQWIRGWGAWGWMAVIGLLISDLFVPLPATGVMAAAGYLYGAWIGGVISATGSFLSGMLAYALCWNYGRAAARYFAGEQDLARGEALFQRRGPWLVALSRALPLLPEVIACLAGVTRMPAGTFALSLACGSVPLGFAYAGIGAAGQQNPGLALALSILVPPLLWALVLFLRDRAPAPTNP